MYRIMAGLALVALPLSAQTRELKGPPDLGTPRNMPPGPTVTDWQPRTRAITEGTIVFAGPNFRVADLRVVIGQVRRLPVNVALSTPTRVVVDVPDDALGWQGPLILTYEGTQGTVVESQYRIDPPAPALIDASVSGGVLVPLVKRGFAVRIREFPGARADVEGIAFSSSCGFHRPGAISFATATRAADLTMRVYFEGWFNRPGTCALQMSIRALNSNGAYLRTVSIAVPFTVATSTRYTLENTSALLSKLNAQVARAGLGNICQANSGDWPGGQRVGVHDVGGDVGVIVRGSLVGVTCHFRTSHWLLPPDFQLAEIAFSAVEVGNRCGMAGTFGPGLIPEIVPPLTRGMAIVRPFSPQDAANYAVRSDDAVVFDGVIYASNLLQPTTVMLPMFFGLQCASMATFLGGPNGSPPTTAPQSLTVRLDRLVFSGPPGFSIDDILR